MQEVHLNCMRIAGEIPLESISEHLGLNFPKKWNEVVVVKGEQLERILKYHTRPHQKVLLYSYGVATFINCAIDEMRIIIDYVDSVTGEIENKDILRSIDVHRIWIKEDGTCKLFLTDEGSYSLTDEVFMISSHIVAQSVATQRIEGEVQELLDHAENTVNRIKKSKFFVSARKRSHLMAEVLRFQYELMRSAQLFGAPVFLNNNLEVREMYHKLYDYYELQDRFDIIRSKLAQLKKINDRYSGMNHHRLETRLLELEVFLLALFPMNFFFGSKLKEVVHWFVSQIAQR